MVDEVLFLYRRARALAEPVKKGEKVSIQNRIDSFLLTQRGVTILTQRNAMGQLSQLEADRFPEVTAESGGKTDLKAAEEGRGGAGAAPGIGKAAQRPSMLTKAPTAEEAIEEAENE